MKVYKYDIDWQVVRAKLKTIKDISAKIDFVKSFYETYPTDTNKERILNWLDGLLIVKSLNIQDKFFLENYAQELKVTNPTIKGINSRKAKDQNFSKYPNTDLELLFSDLFIRAKKWLGSGYINKEFDEFMVELMNNIEPSSPKIETQLNQYKELKERAKFLPNTHKWIY